jgi:hypothetical protein
MNPLVFSWYFIPNTEGKLGWSIRYYKIGWTLYTHMVTTHRCLLSSRIPPLALLQCGGGGFSSQGQQQQTTTTYEIRPGLREVSRTIEFPPSFVGGFCLRVARGNQGAFSERVRILPLFCVGGGFSHRCFRGKSKQICWAFWELKEKMVIFVIIRH